MFGFRKGFCFQGKYSQIYITSVIIYVEPCLPEEMCLIECTSWAAFNLGVDAKYFSKCCPIIFSFFFLFFCTLFKPCLEVKIGHFLGGIVILLFHCSF